MVLVTCKEWIMRNTGRQAYKTNLTQYRTAHNKSGGGRETESLSAGVSVTVSYK